MYSLNEETLKEIQGGGQLCDFIGGFALGAILFGGPIMGAAAFIGSAGCIFGWWC